MSKNYFILDGKKIPMNEEAEQLLREQVKNQHVPVVRMASFDKSLPYDRIIIRLSKPAKKLFEDIESDVVVIDEYGYLANNWLASDELVNGMPGDTYSNIQTLIEGDLP